MQLTDHAIERFQERMEPDLSFESARLALSEATQRAVRLKQKTRRGQFLWSVNDPCMRLVTKRDSGEEIVVTVLSPNEFL